MAKAIVRAGKIGGLCLVPILLVFLIFYALHLSSSAQNVEPVATVDPLSVAPAGPAESPQQTIDPDRFAETISRLRGSCKYDQIRTLCSDILAKETDPDIALVASQALIETAIETRDTAAAEAQTQTLLATFADHPWLTKSLCEIGDAYRRMHDLDQASRIYRLILDGFETHPYSIWSAKNLADMAIQRRDTSAADIALEELTIRFHAHPQIPLALCALGDAWRDLPYFSNPARAESIYRRVIDQFPDNPESVWASKNLCLLYLDQINNPDAARGATIEFLNRFGDQDGAVLAAGAIADGWRKIKDFETAKALYDFVVARAPNSDSSLWASKNLCGLSIERGDEQEAFARIEMFSAHFADHTQFVLALCALGDEYQNAKNFDRAAELYALILRDYAENPDAVWAAKNLAILRIRQDDDQAALEILDTLLTTLSTHWYAGSAANDIGSMFTRSGKYDYAAVVYRRVADRFPASVASLWARQKLINLAIWKQMMTVESPSSIPSEIQETLDRFIADYQEYDDMPLAVVIIGDMYRNRGLILYQQQKIRESIGPIKVALSIFNRVIWNLPHINNSAAEAAYLSGELLFRIGDIESAIAHFKMVVDRWPNFRLAGTAQLQMLQQYDAWMRRGGISRDQAEPIIRQACRELDEKFPELAGGGQSVLFWLEADSKRGTR